MREYKDYIKSETDKNGVLWYWIDEPIFTAIDFKQDIENNYNHLLKRRVKSDLNNELEIEIIKEVIQDFEQAENLKPTYDCNKLLFPEKCFGEWFSDDTIDEFKRYFAEYSDYKYLEFYNEFLKNRLSEIENPKEKLLVNKYTHIFKDDFEFTLFQEMHKIYKEDTKHDLANYSFLFYAMQKDKFIICKQKEFLEFLGKYDISIPKIDSRQIGENVRKEPLYKATKENLFKRT